jgi:small-conductance mechanosensitive channel
MMENKKIQAEVEELKKDENIRRELEQTTESKEAVPAVVETSYKFFRFLTYVLLLLGLGVVHYLLRIKFFPISDQYSMPLRRLVAGTIMVVFVLMLAKIVRTYVIARLDSNVARYNLRRVVNLIAGLGVALIIISILFADWYTAVVSFGLISLILGFALQTPITSFIGWIYILVKAPYQVGDRIKIGEATGDVISVSYLDTTLWEFGGQYLSSDHPSGRIIKFPNSNVLSSAVYNYSWSLFPYIWTEIRFNVAYQSDLEFVSKVMRETAAEEVGEAMMERIRVYRQLLQQTPVDQVQVNEYPTVIFRANQNTWIEVIVRYLADPRGAGQVKSRLILKMLEKLNAEPERVMFPKGDSR